LVLRLGFVAGESRCLPAHDAPGTTPIPAQHHKQHSENPTAPTVPVCCQALTSCALAVDVTRAEVAPLGGSTADRGACALFGSPLSRTTAPEAPPPRLQVSIPVVSYRSPPPHPAM